MTTADLEAHNPSLMQFLAWKFTKAMAKKQARTREVTQVSNWLLATIRVLLHLAGFGSLTYGGFTWHPIAGFVVAGISCFILSWLLTPNPPPTNPTQRR